MTAEDRAVGEEERLHPLFLLTGLGGSLRGIIGGYAGLAYLAAQGQLTIALIGAVVMLAFMVVGVYLYWRRFSFRVGSNEIRIDSGIVSRNHRSIPFDRVQDVDISQGPLARLLGLAAVKFETGGASGVGEEAVLHAVTLQRAEEIRTLVRSYRTADSAAAADPDDQADSDAQVTPVFALDNKRLLLAGLFNFSLAVFAGLIGVTQTFGEALGFDPLNRRFWADLLSQAGPLADYILAHRLAAAAAGLLLLILIGSATGIVRTVLREFGFRLDRTERGLRRRRGLLTRTDVTLAVKRVQAAIIASGPVRERFGWSALKVQSLASDQGKESDHMLAPLATGDEIDRILGELGWRELGTPDYRRVARAFVWLRVIALSPLILVALLLLLAAGLMPFVADGDELMTVGLAGLFAPTIIVIAASAVAIGLRWLDWRRFGYVLDGDRLLVRSGWWRRRRLILPLARIQSFDIRQSFVGRWLGVCTLIFGVAGAGALSIHQIPAVQAETARKLRRELLSPVA
jgi:putative membrane protein